MILSPPKHFLVGRWVNKHVSEHKKNGVEVSCKLMSNIIGGVLEEECEVGEDQAGFRRIRGCVDDV